MALTPEDVRNKRFTAVRFKEGYDLDEVDSFLDEVEDSLTELSRVAADLQAAAKGEIPASIRESLIEFENENKALKQLVDSLQHELESASAQVAAATTGDSVDRGVVDELNKQIDQLRSELAESQEDKNKLNSEISSLKQAAAQGVSAPVDAADISTASVRILELAQRTADEAVSIARIEAEELKNKTSAEVESLMSEAKTGIANMTREFEVQRASLERKVEELRAYEREYRSRLRSYLEGQIRELDGNSLAGEEITQG